MYLSWSANGYPLDPLFQATDTGATVNYARKMGWEIIMIGPITLYITHEGLSLDSKP